MTVDIKTGLLDNLEYMKEDEVMGDLMFNSHKYLLTHPDGRRLEVVLDWVISFSDAKEFHFNQQVKQALFDKLPATTNADVVYYLFEAAGKMCVVPFNRKYLEAAATLGSKDFMKVFSDEGITPVTIIRLSSFWNSPDSESCE